MASITLLRLPLLFVLATAVRGADAASAACDADPFEGCVFCGNGQTCHSIAALDKAVAFAKTDQQCCKLVGALPDPGKATGRDGFGLMWSWNETAKKCSVFAGNEPELRHGDGCKGGRLHLLPTPTIPPVQAAPAGAKNVLYIVIDDLRPELAGGYDHTAVHTPNLAAFATEATVFERAYCQFALCGPSRNSFMTGRRPDSTTAYNFGRHFRMPDVGPDWTSMPEHFRNNGYLVMAQGKLYHPNVPPMYDTPLSWSAENGEIFLNDDSWPGGEKGDDPMGSHCSEQQPSDICGNIAWCAVNNSALEATLGDNVNLAQAVARLTGPLKKKKEAKTREEDEDGGAAQKPFFMAVGLHKPHLPWSVPKKYFDMQPAAEDIALPKHPLPPSGMPPVAFNPTGNCTSTRPMTDEHARLARRAYMAAISYMDDNVGKILKALDESGRADDTLVIFHADHGWQLGEHGEWRKMTNFDLATRVPLMMRAPWKAASKGKRASALVELVGLYPTLVELLGLPTPSDSHKLEGQSFAALLDDATAALPQNWAMSQYTRCPGFFPDPYNSPCAAADLVNDNVTVMGYSLRVPDWRYTEWASFDGQVDGGKGRVDWTAPLHGVELYDHSAAVGDVNDFDAHENENLANKPEHADLVKMLSQQLRAIVAKYPGGSRGDGGRSSSSAAEQL